MNDLLIAVLIPFAFGIMFGFAAATVFTMALNWTQDTSHGDVDGIGCERRDDVSRFSEREEQTTRDIEEASSVDDAPLELRALYVAAFITPAAKSLMKKGAGNAHKLQSAIEDAESD